MPPPQLEFAVKAAVSRALEGNDAGGLLEILRIARPGSTGFLQVILGLSRRCEERRQSLRRHCLQTAALAAELATAGGGSGEAFVAGMLHDIHALLHGDGLPLRDAGAALDSSLQSASLLRAWNLPSSIVDAIAAHGRAQQTGLSPPVGLGRVLWIAHRFAHRVDGSAQLDAGSASRLASTLGFNRRTLDQAIAGARIRYVSLATGLDG